MDLNILDLDTAKKMLEEKKIKDEIDLIENIMHEATCYPGQKFYISLTNHTDEDYIPISYIKYFDIIESNSNYMTIDLVVEANTTKIVKIYKDSSKNEMRVDTVKTSGEAFAITTVDVDKYFDELSVSTRSDREIVAKISIEAFSKYIKEESKLALSGVIIYIHTAEECDYVTKIIKKKKSRLLWRENYEKNNKTD